ncbi:helix-turn-helix domain-containing protein [Diaphorobacter caeni]|uniref:DNA-binding protein n=1 Tax=Diaphorobacter caeni TaxID=2784387 RepID=UPI00188F83FD|nr:DNA-binding protein [Diaphorobacter caeni]MBF5006382.1 DNA-binding protein [Diaphorobacter caeni]
MTKSRAQIRAEFAHRGQSITAWAKAKGFTPNTVMAILNDNEASPRLKCLRGEAHDIAVELKLKDGEASRRLAA